MAIDKALILPYSERLPEVHPTAYIAPTAVLIGECVVGERASVFFHCVLRGDINRVEVGAGSNIQDLSMLHVDDDWPCIVGREVTVGHRAVIHGCTGGDRCVIGMGAVVLNGAVIGADSIVAASGVGTIALQRVSALRLVTTVGEIPTFVGCGVGRILFDVN